MVPQRWWGWTAIREMELETREDLVRGRDVLRRDRDMERYEVAIEEREREREREREEVRG